MKLLSFVLAIIITAAVTGHSQSKRGGPPKQRSAASGTCDNLTTVTGKVVKISGQYCFKPDNEPENCQRLTKASLGEDKVAKQIKLDTYAHQTLEVRGQWEHEWICCAEIIKQAPSKKDNK
jgi:hypothetical protein